MKNSLIAEEIASNVKAYFPLHPVPLNIGISALSQKINAFFTGRAWPSVTADALLNESDLGADHALTWMNSEGYRYYLPAYLIITLEQKIQGLSWFLEPIFTGLCAYEIFSTFVEATTPQIDPSKVECFEKFTQEQKKTIADFLLYFSTKSQGASGNLTSLNILAKLAYESYWSQFL